jgi:D-beta-D-heptose 7-phosphate kinase/D-beta-D-heptose 1-phosphate adenosyltransferase
VKGFSVDFEHHPSEIAKRFVDARVLVVGDVMLDRYWWGTVNRISPEAPVPVVKLERQTLAAGGAANVAANIAGLGATPLLVGLIGDDEGGRELAGVLKRINVAPDYLVKSLSRPTTVKTRIVAHHQQVVRIDDENVSTPNEEQSRRLEEHILKLLPTVKAILFSDYAKGALQVDMISRLIAKTRELGISVLVDPKGRDYKRYAGASLLTPNRKEAMQASGLDQNEPHDINEIGEKLLSELKIEALLITLGEDGMALFRFGKEPLRLPAMARAVYDVTGAGDTVIATLGVAVAAGASLPDAAKLANIAAGLVVEQIGTTAIDLDVLNAALR